MKIQKFPLIIGLLIIIVIIISGCVEKKQRFEYIDPGDWGIEKPSIYKDKIVWEDYRNDKSNADIYLYELSKNKEYPIIIDNIWQKKVGIYDNKIVWQDGATLIKIYDLINNNIQEIPTKNYNYNPKIYKDNIVWMYDSLNGSYNIKFYNIQANDEKLIANNGSAPDIWSNYIVWIDFRNSKLSESGIPQTTDIYLYDLISNQEILISNYKSIKIHPRIYENTIIWADKRNAKSGDFQYDIYMYDLLKKEEVQITKSQSVNGDYNFDIYGDIIVWTDKRNDKGDIYIYDLTKDKEIPICTDNGLQCDPAIYENKVIWKDESGKGGRFVLYEIGDDETYILGLESTTFYISATALIIILIIILILIIRIRRKKRKLVKFEMEKEESKAESLKTQSQSFQCPNCNKSFKLTETKRPVTVKCPHCGVRGEVK